MCANRLRSAIVLFFAGLVLSGLFRLNVHGDTWPIVLTGELAPGTPDGRFTGLSQAAVNSSGQIVFTASINVGGAQTQGIFRVDGGVLFPIVLAGQSLPDAQEQAFRSFGDPQINNAGDILFIANFLSSGSALRQGLFLHSRGTLRKVLDDTTAAPGTQGQTFGMFREAHINDSGDIAFAADLNPPPVNPGIYFLKQGVLRFVANTNSLNGPFLSLNNRGEIAFVTQNNGVAVLSNESILTLIVAGQPVSNTDMTVFTQGPLSMNDDGDIVFVNYRPSGGGRGGNLPTANGIVRTRGGVLEKVATGGDPAPGIPGSTLTSSEFLSPEINKSGVLFTTRTIINGSAVNLIVRQQDRQLSVIAREDQFVPGLSTLRFIGEANFDTTQGPLTTFVANLGPMAGIFAATVPQFTLLFPQIADGAAAADGWRTTVVLANRSTSPASAIVNFFDDFGSPMSVGSGGQQQSQYSVTVPALGVTQFKTDGVGNLKVGWATVQTDQSLSGIALFSSTDAMGNLTDEVGASATVPLRSFSAFVQRDAATGVAVVNPNTSRADVTLILKNADSTEIARSSISVPPMGHLAKYANEFFTGAADFDGRIEVVSTQPLAAITLRQRGRIFTSLPVIP